MKIANKTHAAACFAAVLLAGCGFYPGTATRLKNAEAELAAGKYQDAASELGVVLKRDGTNAAALVTLTRVQLKLGDVEAAQSYLKRALAAGASATELADLINDVLLARRQFNELLKANSSADLSANANRLAMRGVAQLALKDNAAAEQSLAAALKLDANHSKALLYMAQLRLVQGKPEEALLLLDQILAKDPALAQAGLMRGSLLMADRKFAQASDAFKRVAEATPGSASVPEEIQALASQAEALLAQNDVKSTGDVVKRLKSRYPGAIPTHYLQGRLALLRGDAQTAVNEFRTVIKAAPDNISVKTMLGAALLATGSREQALAMLSEAVAQNPADQNARNLLARAQLANNKPDEARATLLDKPGATSDDAQADWLMASSLLMTGDVKGGIPWLEKAAAAAPANTQVQVELARAYLMTGAYESARGLLDKLPEDKRDARVQQLRVMSRIGGKSGPDAMKELEALVTASASDADLLAVAGGFALNMRDAATAGRYFAQALQISPDNATARLGAASVAAGAGDLKTAAMHLQAVLRVNPRSQQAMLALASIALRQSDKPGAQQWLAKAISADPSAVQPRLSLAQLEYQGGSASKATSLLDQAIAVATDKRVVTNVAGELALAAGQKEEALKRFEAAVQLGNASAALNVARAQIALGRGEAARQTLAAIKDQPAANQASLMLVSLDASAGKFADARARIAALRKTGLNAAAASELEGDVSWVARQVDAAARSYSEAYAAQPSQALTIKLFRSQLAQKAAEPEKILERWLEQSPADGAVRMLLANALLDSGKYQAAIAEYETVEKAAKPDPVTLNNLAWAYYKVKDPRALPMAKQAYEMAASNAGVADTYGWLLLESGDIKSSKPILEGAAAKAPGIPSIAYHLAAVRARSGDKGGALRGLNTLLESRQDFPEKRDAEQLQKQLAAP